jgi:putative ATPase
MIKAGEDPVFIARRMVIFASEDITNADPQALILATATMQAVHMVGMPEAQIVLAQCATYLASAPKSIASYAGLMAAMSDIDEKRLEPVPLHLRNPVNKVYKELGAGKGHIRYEFQDPKNHKNQTYLPDNLIGRKYYKPPK